MRKGNRRCPFLFAPAAGAALSRRPQTANPPLRFSEKLPARQGRIRLRSSSTPGQSVQGNDSFPIDTVGIPRYTYN